MGQHSLSSSDDYGGSGMSNDEDEQSMKELLESVQKIAFTMVERAAKELPGAEADQIAARALKILNDFMSTSSNASIIRPQFEAIVMGIGFLAKRYGSDGTREEVKTKTYYTILEVSSDASQSVITAAYKALAQKHHPDKNGGAPKATQMMAIINRAYSVLSDPIKKKIYDDELNAKKSASSDFKANNESAPNSQPESSSFNPSGTVDLIIPFTVSKDELKKQVYEYIASGNYTPDDMLALSTFTKQEFFYVPAFIFKIEYTATWTATFGYDRTEHYTVYETQSLGRDSHGNSRGTHQVPVTKTKTVTDWRPANGVDSGNFSVSTYAGNKLNETRLNPEKLVDHAINFGSITDFRSSYMDGFETESFSVSKHSAYESLESEISSDIDQSVKKHGQGDHQRDWHWNAQTSYSTSKIYVPIYHAIFDYKGTKYNVWLDGIGTYNRCTIYGISADKLPEDTERKNLVDTIRENLIPSIRKTLVYLGFVPMVIGIVGLIISHSRGNYASIGELVNDLYVIAGVGGCYAAIRSFYLIDYSNYLTKHANYIIEFSKNNRDSLLKQIHASSKTLKVTGDEERVNMVPLREFYVNGPLIARMFTATHFDKIVIPVLTILLLCFLIFSAYRIDSPISPLALPKSLSQLAMHESSDTSKYAGNVVVVFNDSSVNPIFRSLLGKEYDLYAQNMNVSSDVKIVGDYYFGSACKAHACGTDESVFAVRKSDGKIYAAMKNVNKITLLGGIQANDLPPPLKNWVNENSSLAVVKSPEETTQQQPNTATAVVADLSASASVAVANRSEIAEWVKVGAGKDKDGEYTFYVNPASISSADNKATMQDMLDYKTTQTISNKPYLSSIQLHEFDCKDKQWRELSINRAYSGNMGSGEVTDETLSVPSEWEKVPPGTINSMWKIACGHSSQASASDGASSTPVASQRASFDCKKAKSASEVLICNDSELSKLDFELAEIYREAKANASDAQAFRNQTITAWKWRESNCLDNKDCLIKWYAERKFALLKNIQGTASN